MPTSSQALQQLRTHDPSEDLDFLQGRPQDTCDDLDLLQMANSSSWMPAVSTLTPDKCLLLPAELDRPGGVASGLFPDTGEEVWSLRPLPGVPVRKNPHLAPETSGAELPADGPSGSHVRVCGGPSHLPAIGSVHAQPAQLISALAQASKQRAKVPQTRAPPHNVRDHVIDLISRHQQGQQTTPENAGDWTRRPPLACDRDVSGTDKPRPILAGSGAKPDKGLRRDSKRVAFTGSTTNTTLHDDCGSDTATFEPRDGILRPPSTPELDPLQSFHDNDDVTGNPHHVTPDLTFTDSGKPKKTAVRGRRGPAVVSRRRGGGLAFHAGARSGQGVGDDLTGVLGNGHSLPGGLGPGLVQELRAFSTGACGLLTINSDTGRHEWKLQSSYKEAFTGSSGLRGTSRKAPPKKGKQALPFGLWVSPYEKMERIREDKERSRLRSLPSIFDLSLRVGKGVGVAGLMDVCGQHIRLPGTGKYTQGADDLQEMIESGVDPSVEGQGRGIECAQFSPTSIIVPSIVIHTTSPDRLSPEDDGEGGLFGGRTVKDGASRYCSFDDVEQGQGEGKKCHAPTLDARSKDLEKGQGESAAPSERKWERKQKKMSIASRRENVEYRQGEYMNRPRLRSKLAEDEEGRIGEDTGASATCGDEDDARGVSGQFTTRRLSRSGVIDRGYFHSHGQAEGPDSVTDSGWRQMGWSAGLTEEEISKNVERERQGSMASSQTARDIADDGGTFMSSTCTLSQTRNHSLYDPEAETLDLLERSAAASGLHARHVPPAAAAVADDIERLGQQGMQTRRSSRGLAERGVGDGDAGSRHADTLTSVRPDHIGQPVVPPPFSKAAIRRATPSPIEVTPAPEPEMPDVIDLDSFSGSRLLRRFGPSVMRMRKELPPPDPKKLCFQSHIPGCTHLEVISCLESAFPGVKVATLQYDPVHLQDYREPSTAGVRFKCLWLFSLTPESDPTALLLRGFRLRGQRMNIRRADDVYLEEQRAFSLCWEMLRRGLLRGGKGHEVKEGNPRDEVTANADRRNSNVYRAAERRPPRGSKSRARAARGKQAAAPNVAGPGAVAAPSQFYRRAAVKAAH